MSPRRMGNRRRTDVVVLCEDQQQQVFARRFLLEMDSKWQVRSVLAPRGKGSAEQFVRRQFVEELSEHRRRHVSTTLVVMIDGDNRGPARRKADLEAACKEQDVPFVGPSDRVLIVVPTWRIETWLAYLEGQDVDETERHYPRLPRPRECQKHVEALADMCRKKDLRRPVPESLAVACDDYRRINRSGRGS